MKRIVLCSVAFVGLIALAPDDSFGQNKAPAKGKVITAGYAEYAYLAGFKEMAGTLQSIDNDSLVLRVNYDHAVQKANPTTTNTPRPRNPQQAQQQQIAAANRALNNVTIAHDFIDFDIPFQTKPAMTVRRMGAGGFQYDEKGDIKVAPKTTGTSALPGAPAATSDLTPGAKVRIFLDRPKTTAAKRDAKGGLISDETNRPQARMVVILDENGAVGPADTKKKNK